jgi:hypothetical protein
VFSFSLEEIEEMDRRRLQAIESLEISDFDHSVKCQRCGIAIPTYDDGGTIKQLKQELEEIVEDEKSVIVFDRYR